MKKVFKNVISSTLPQIVNILSNLILPGLIIAKFGSDVNGLVSTTKTVISYISLVGAGIATAVTQALYQPVANEDDLAVKGMLRSANGMFNRYGWLFLMITLIVAAVYPFAIDSEIPYFTVMLLLIVMSLSGASEFLTEGLVTYSNESKINRLGVEERAILTQGAVSSTVAYQMAAGLLKGGKCDVAVATTGIAGPNSDGTGKPVGLGYVAVGMKDGVHTYRYNFSGSRGEIMETAKNTALFLTIKKLKNV